jgi:hypothetical protein
LGQRFPTFHFFCIFAPPAAIDTTSPCDYNPPREGVFDSGGEHSMHVEQKHVTIVNLHDGKRREFVLLRDERGYRLTAISPEEVVNVLLSASDLLKLRREVAKEISQPNFDECITATPPPLPVAAAAPIATDWLSFN